MTRGPGRPITDGARASAWPDLGWAVACLGLLLAAACIGTHPGRAREAAGRGRAALAALLRPLTGRG